MNTIDFSAGLTLASGFVQAFVAAVFWRFMATRPEWGLRWLAASFGLASVLNLSAWYTMPLTPQHTAFIAIQLIMLLVGVSCMAALTAGVRLYLGEQQPGPWGTFWGVWALYSLIFAAQKLWVHQSMYFLGAALAGLIYIYLAVLCMRVAKREPRVGHNVAGFMMAVYAPMVWLGYQMGLSAKDLRYWGAVPYSLAGLGLLAASMGRFRAELKELNGSLEARVSSRTQELEELVQGLESFNQTVSHDLRGPLGGVHGLSELAIQSLEQGDTDRALHMLRAVHSASGELAELVTELLTLAKASQVDIHKQSVCLQSIVDAAIQTVEVSRGDGRTHAVQFNGLNTDVAVDPTLMKQVMVNLIGNALKFSSQAAHPQVHVTAKATDDGCEVVVADNGVGFDASKKIDLFKPFKRLHSGKEFEGTGIGLTIVQRVVTGHGGRVWADSTPGQGARFHVWLPAA